MRLFGLAGWSGAGKTTLLVHLVAILSGRGFSVSTIKHAHHGFDIDKPGKDTYRHREAGAAQVMVASDRRWALMTELPPESEPGIDDLVARMEPVDLVLIEGFKAYRHDKIEVHRPSLGKPRLPHDPTIIAVASDAPLGDAALPVLDLNQPERIADFILARTGLA
jgi:molybdopterin-guanine dinucleotide biosynthesis protein B